MIKPTKPRVAAYYIRQALESAGPDGVSVQELRVSLAEVGLPKRSHVWQGAKTLKNSGYAFTVRRGPKARYTKVQTTEQAENYEVGGLRRHYAEQLSVCRSLFGIKGVGSKKFRDNLLRDTILAGGMVGLGPEEVLTEVHALEILNGGPESH